MNIFNILIAIGISILGYFSYLVLSAIFPPKKKVNFHEICIDCVMQKNEGLGYCAGCQYMEPNWDLPDLSFTTGNRFVFKSFHGGCIECSMQKKHGIEYCNGCQYKEGNWDLPCLNDHSIKEDARRDKARNKTN